MLIEFSLVLYKLLGPSQLRKLDISLLLRGFDFDLARWLLHLDSYYGDLDSDPFAPMTSDFVDALHMCAAWEQRAIKYSSGSRLLTSNTVPLLHRDSAVAYLRLCRLPTTLAVLQIQMLRVVLFWMHTLQLCCLVIV
jgi:hypothetical protein